MIALFVQTLLLLGAAYFLGAALACLVRRSLSAETRRSMPAERRVDPLPEAAQRAEGPGRFGRLPHAGRVRQAQPAAATAEPRQDLKRIRLIDASIEAGLSKLGITRYDQIAAWLQSDIARVSEALGLEDRINRENWIEQAQVLAKGGETYYARRRARGEAANAGPTPDEGERRVGAPTPEGSQIARSPRASTGGAAAVAAEIATATVAAAAVPVASPGAAPASVSDRAAFAAPRRAAHGSGVSGEPTAGAMPAPAVPVRPPAAVARDNLLRISSIDGEAEKLLASHGVTRYRQIAQWSPADVDHFDRLISGAGRIQRENWIEQAQILSRGGDTAFSREYDRKVGGDGSGMPRPTKLADAIRENVAKTVPKPDLGSLRSVRPQSKGEEPGPEAAHRVATQNRVVRSAALEDLKRIRGIGVLIEKKLNSMGVVSYEQIANWTAQDIDRVSQQLDFKGRIERENWVEQARILASGGTTDFSRRFDGGEAEISRYKT